MGYLGYGLLASSVIDETGPWVSSPAEMGLRLVVLQFVEIKRKGGVCRAVCAGGAGGGLCETA